MARARSKIDLVGLVEVAAMLRVEIKTAYRWRYRGILPEPEWNVSRTPLWQRETIVDWAKSTDRWRELALAS